MIPLNKGYGAFTCWLPHYALIIQVVPHRHWHCGQVGSIMLLCMDQYPDAFFCTKPCRSWEVAITHRRADVNLPAGPWFAIQGQRSIGWTQKERVYAALMDPSSWVFGCSWSAIFRRGTLTCLLYCIDLHSVISASATMESRMEPAL